MKLSVLKKLRTRTWRRREKTHREYNLETPGPHNLYRKRLEGQIEALDKVLDDIDWHINKQHDLWVAKGKK